MSGFNLESAIFRQEQVSDEVLWKAVNKVFSTKTANSSTYKFVFLKSILDLIEAYRKSTYTFYEIFERFTEIYWKLIVKCGLPQTTSKSKETYIEQIIKDYVGNTLDVHPPKLNFYDLSSETIHNLVLSVVKKCKIYVVGALYTDTDGLFYSFSKKQETLTVNPLMLKFIEKHNQAIQELNYFELTKFLYKVSPCSVKEFVVKYRNHHGCADSFDAYRQLVYDEIELLNLPACRTNINTVDLLIEADKSLSLACQNELENTQAKSLICSSSLDNDVESMMKYLDEPERIIKMLKIRKALQK